MRPTANRPTLLIMAGGTGGHIMPGLAVGRKLREQGWDVVWLGNPDAMEGKLVPPQDIPLAPVRFAGLRGKGWATRLAMPWRLAKACWQAWQAFGRYRPDVVLGMGGYVAFPGGLIAYLRRVPLVLHEQNAVAGLTNRSLTRFARRVLTGFPNTLPGATVTGNPVRQDLTELADPAMRWQERQGPLRVLVVGGSLGAQALNEQIPRALSLLREQGLPVPQVLHQSGAAHLPALQQAYAAAGVQADCRAFIDDMASAYGEADLVICRAGAMTVAEVAAVGVPALFIPFPHAVDDHQTRNARFLADRDAAWVLDQKELEPARLATWLAARNREDLLTVAQAAKNLAQMNATADIAQICAQQADRERP